MRKKGALALVALALAASATGACDDGSDARADDSSDTEGITEEALPQSITITATDFDFDQDGITLEPGEIDVTLVNDGDVQHSFTSYELDSDLDLVVSPGDEGSTTFTLPAGETFPFYCKFHPDEMRGGIYVDRTSD